MSLKVNGIEAKSIKVEENGTVTDLTNLRIYKNGEIVLNWYKPYTLSISKSSHSNVTVGYKTSQYSVVIGELTNGSTINHGYYLDITITGQQGYKVSWKLNGVTQSSTNVTIPITGNVSIVVTEVATAVPLTSPVISGTFNFDSYGGFYYLTCNIKNNNARAVTASILVYSNGDRLERTYELNIPANSTETYHHGEMFSSGAKVNVTFSCSGYGDSYASTTFGNYTGSGSPVDETTSTTTTS